MRRPLTLLSGAVAGFGLYKLVAARRRSPAIEGPPEPREDPRAEELRRKPAQSRTMDEDRRHVRPVEPGQVAARHEAEVRSAGGPDDASLDEPRGAQAARVDVVRP